MNTKLTFVAVLGDVKNAKHLYDVQVRLINGNVRKIEVHANNAAQARKIADQFDHFVMSVNMVG